MNVFCGSGSAASRYADQTIPERMKYDIATMTRDILAVPRPNHTGGQAPLICVDECLNDGRLFTAFVGLAVSGRASGSMPLWNERRLRDDGEVFYVWGGYDRHRV